MTPSAAHVSIERFRRIDELVCGVGLAPDRLADRFALLRSTAQRMTHDRNRGSGKRDRVRPNPRHGRRDSPERDAPVAAAVVSPVSQRRASCILPPSRTGALLQPGRSSRRPRRRSEVLPLLERRAPNAPRRRWSSRHLRRRRSRRRALRSSRQGASRGRRRVPPGIEMRLCMAPSKARARRFASSQLGPRDPLTPAEAGLPLLPSGSDGVHQHAPQRARPSTPLARGRTLAPPPSGSPSAPRERVVDCRGPLAPHLAQALAEGAGFEPAVPQRVHQFSKLADSAALPPLRRRILGVAASNCNVTSRCAFVP